MRIRRAKFAQDGHTPTEQSIYECLWRKAKSMTAEARLVQIGVGQLAKETQLDKKTVQRNLRRLESKLSITTVHAHRAVDGTPKTYRIYSYSEILGRRAAAGLVDISRKGRFVADPPTGPPRARTAHAGVQSSANRGEALEWFRDALWRYAKTDYDGRPLAAPPTFAGQPPDNAIVLRAAEACGWDCAAAADLLIRLKRNGPKVRSYGFFPVAFMNSTTGKREGS